MIIVADASPLIFLGKLGQLKLIPLILEGRILIPGAVRDEILASPAAPSEIRLLTAFLSSCEIVKVLRPEHFANAMSRADDEALTLAIRRHAHWLLADERLLRDMAEVEKIRPIGTLGVLLRAMKTGHLSKDATRMYIDTLIREHGFRIGISLYENVLRVIAAG